PPSHTDAAPHRSVPHSRTFFRGGALVIGGPFALGRWSPRPTTPTAAPTAFEGRNKTLYISSGPNRKRASSAQSLKFIGPDAQARRSNHINKNAERQPRGGGARAPSRNSFARSTPRLDGHTRRPWRSDLYKRSQP